MHQPVTTVKQYYRLMACLLGTTGCLSQSIDAELSVKTVQSIIAVESTKISNPRLLVVIDTSYLAKVGISGNTAMKRLAESIDPRARLGIPSADAVCAGNSQSVCFIFRILTYQRTDTGAVARGRWFAYLPQRCTETQEATYLLNQIGGSMIVDRITDVDRGICGTEVPVRLRLRPSTMQLRLRPLPDTAVRIPW